jgi:hypothetical protein
MALVTAAMSLRPARAEEGLQPRRPRLYLLPVESTFRCPGHPPPGPAGGARHQIALMVAASTCKGSCMGPILWVPRANAAYWAVHGKRKADLSPRMDYDLTLSGIYVIVLTSEGIASDWAGLVKGHPMALIGEHREHRWSIQKSADATRMEKGR